MSDTLKQLLPQFAERSFEILASELEHKYSVKTPQGYQVLKASLQFLDGDKEIFDVGITTCLATPSEIITSQ